MRKENDNSLWMLAQLPFPNKEMLEYEFSISKKEDIEPDIYKKERDLLEVGVFKELLKPNIKILDIGCGHGMLLYRIQMLNKTASLYGTEPSEYRSKYATESLDGKASIYTTTIEKTFFEKNYFDYIICMAVIEHVSNPFLLVEKMYDWLKQDGKIIMSFTNADGLVPRLNLHKWRSAESCHQWLPGKRTAFKLLDEIGFKVIKYFTYGGFPAPRTFFQEIINKFAKLINMGDVLTLVGEKK